MLVWRIVLNRLADATMTEGFREKTAQIGEAMPNESSLQEEAKEALQEAYERLPTEHPWGYYHYMDGPPAAG